MKSLTIVHAHNLFTSAGGRRYSFFKSRGGSQYWKRALHKSDKCEQYQLFGRMTGHVQALKALTTSIQHFQLDLEI